MLIFLYTRLSVDPMASVSCNSHFGWIRRSHFSVLSMFGCWHLPKCDWHRKYEFVILRIRSFVWL